MLTLLWGPLQALLGRSTKEMGKWENEIQNVHFDGEGNTREFSVHGKACVEGEKKRSNTKWNKGVVSEGGNKIPPR